MADFEGLATFTGVFGQAAAAVEVMPGIDSPGAIDIPCAIVIPGDMVGEIVGEIVVVGVAPPVAALVAGQAVNNGSGAIRDVDLFTSDPDVAAFDSAINELVDVLGEGARLEVDVVRRAERFAQVRVTAADGQSVEMDLAVDWRESEPVTLSIGPVLSLQDAVGNKVSALYSRAEARDYRRNVARPSHRLPPGTSLISAIVGVPWT